MKHIKKFNEARSSKDRMYESKYDEIQDLCEGSLAFLLDEGYEFNIRPEKYGRNRSFIFLLYKDYQFMNWEDIKDYFIPFLDRLKDKCDIKELPLYVENKNSAYRYIDEDPKNRTIRFTIPEWSKSDDRPLYYHTDINKVINSDPVIRYFDDPTKFTQIQIHFSLK